MFQKTLKEINACSDAVKWVNKKSFRESWDTCQRADWMLWYVAKKELGTKKDRIHIVCDCAQTAMKYVPEGEDRPQAAINAAREYADNPNAETLRKLNAAREAAWYAAWAVGNAAGYAARYAAGYAARYAAGYAAGYAAWDAAWAVENAAWYAAWDAAWAVENAAGDATGDAAHKQMSNMIREKFKV